MDHFIYLDKRKTLACP